MAKREDFSDIKPRGIEPQKQTKKEFEMKTVNLPDGVTINLPVDDLGDLIKVFYKGVETYLKAMANGSITKDDLIHLLPLLMVFPEALTGANNIIPQAKDLTDEEIASLVALSENYELGEFAPKARGLVKLLLVGSQTGFLF